MTDNDFKALIDLMKKKKEVLEEILIYSQKEKFTSSDKSVVKFKVYIEKREVLFNRVREIENKIKKYIIDTEAHRNCLYREVEKIDSDTKSIIKKLIAIDSKNKLIMENLLGEIKEDYKKTKLSQKMNNGYHSVYSTVYTGSRFDSRQ